MARLLNASADVNLRRMEACWVASRGSPVADSALVAAAMGINSFAMLLLVASLAALRRPAKIGIWLGMEFDLYRLFNLLVSEYGSSD